MVDAVAITMHFFTFIHRGDRNLLNFWKFLLIKALFFLFFKSFSFYRCLEIKFSVMITSVWLDDAFSLDDNVIIKVSCLVYLMALYTFHTLSCVYDFLAWKKQVQLTIGYLNQLVLSISVDVFRLTQIYLDVRSLLSVVRLSLKLPWQIIQVLSHESSFPANVIEGVAWILWDVQIQSHVLELNWILQFDRLSRCLILRLRMFWGIGS